MLLRCIFFTLHINARCTYKDEEGISSKEASGNSYFQLKSRLTAHLLAGRLNASAVSQSDGSHPCSDSRVVPHSAFVLWLVVGSQAYTPKEDKQIQASSSDKCAGSGMMDGICHARMKEKCSESVGSEQTANKGAYSMDDGAKQKRRMDEWIWPGGGHACREGAADERTNQPVMAMRLVGRSQGNGNDDGGGGMEWIATAAEQTCANGDIKTAGKQQQQANSMCGGLLHFVDLFTVAATIPEWQLPE